MIITRKYDNINQENYLFLFSTSISSYDPKEVIVIFYYLQKEREHLLRQIQSLSDSISTLPKGKLIYSRCGGHTKWLISNGSNPILIPKRNISLAKELALQKYYTLKLEENIYKLKQIDKFLLRYQKCPDKSAAMLSESSYYKELLDDFFIPPSDILEQWIHAEYPTNPRKPEHLIHKCILNHFVRSKSEVIIANSLYLNNIPYRYECALQLGDITVYPDFTICHPHTNQIYYWEHFGLIDNRQYRQGYANKILTYGDYHIYPSINLITTFETAENPIDSGKIEEIVHEYFCK